MVARRVLMTGSSGLIGSALAPLLRSTGWLVTSLVRGTPRGTDQIVWDPAQPISPDTVSGFDAVIHLAGESIVGRWTDHKKRQIRDSRVIGTRSLSEALARAASRPKKFIVASAIGYYGDRGEEVLTEGSPSGSGFLPSVCREWETASEPASRAGIRTIHLRTGIVLSTAGGALKEMLTPFRFGVGGIIGNGRQWWSWIHLADMVGGIVHVLGTSSVIGAVNFVAPEPVRNSEFTKTLGAVLVRPTMFPMPAFLARTVFGEMADELLLASQRVSASKLETSGYQFQFRSLRPALEDMLKKSAGRT